jgi:ribosome-associated toxin RatA of RatAB toxin-antitoxin module
LSRLSKKSLAILLGATLTLQSLSLHAAELLDVQVDLRNERYRLYSEVQFDVSREALYDLLIDYEKFEKFTSAIVESKNVEADEKGRPGFYARMEGCVLLFCKSFIRNGYLLLTPITEIVAITDPEESDFKYSRERWQLIPTDEGTLMIYDFEMEPAFWVPPVIGPYLIQKTLRRGAHRAVDRIEALAVVIETENETTKAVDYWGGQ